MNTNSKQNPLVMILLVVILALVAYLAINGVTKTTQVAENQPAAAGGKSGGGGNAQALPTISTSILSATKISISATPTVYSGVPVKVVGYDFVDNTGAVSYIREDSTTDSVARVPLIKYGEQVNLSSATIGGLKPGMHYTVIGTACGYKTATSYFPDYCAQTNQISITMPNAVQEATPPTIGVPFYLNYSGGANPVYRAVAVRADDVTGMDSDPSYFAVTMTFPPLDSGYRMLDIYRGHIHAWNNPQGAIYYYTLDWHADAGATVNAIVTAEDIFHNSTTKTGTFVVPPFR